MNFANRHSRMIFEMTQQGNRHTTVVISAILIPGDHCLLLQIMADPSSYSNFFEAKAIHYALNWNLDFENQILGGVVVYNSLSSPCTHSVESL